MKKKSHRKLVRLFNNIFVIIQLLLFVGVFVLALLNSNNSKTTTLILISLIVVTIFTEALFIIQTILYRKRIRSEEKKYNEILEEVMKTFTSFIDNKDPYTRNHSTRVAKYSKEIAARLGKSKKEQLNIYYAGLMHDIGKITIKDEVLFKQGHLSNEDWEMIQAHTTNGANLLKDFDLIPEIKDAVLYHHERYDGYGYVNRLKGKEIPEAARIVSIADSYDAMTTTRIYRLPFSEERTLSELERCAGKQFDPDLIQIMIKIIKDGTIYKL